MARTITQQKRWPALALLLGILSLAACGRAKPRRAAQTTTLQGSIAPIVDAFNAAVKRPRVLLIVSPT
ncbi:MAG: hypothetical protein ACRD04_03955 [Terriglobales bacterium]